MSGARQPITTPAGRGGAAARPWRAFLTEWEAVQLEALAVARDEILRARREDLRRARNRRRAHARAQGASGGATALTEPGASGPYPELAKIFTMRMTYIRNRARQRERIARGVHASCRRGRAGGRGNGAKPGKESTY